ncbi:MAG: TetR/AcrR family transcriptional regulator [Rhizobiaceae bacterium]|nr:TetR/AcrR family transcriptional regulator [Rhizobiaceae bacterium]
MRTPRTGNYANKEARILDAAGTLFANSGYPFVKMEDIAKKCELKKSTLYHYFATKDDILRAIIDEHMDNLLRGLEDAVAHKDSPEDAFIALLEAYTMKSAQSRRQHLVSINDLKFLPGKSQKDVVDRQRKVVDLIAESLGRLNEDYPREALRFYAMLLVGMLNWTDIWYRPSGEVSPKELCRRIARLFTTEMAAGAPPQV